MSDERGRLFWAVTLPEPVEQALIAIQDELRAACPNAPVRWVDPLRSGFHLTVKFLGESADPGAPIAVTRSCLAAFQPFSLELAAAGSFGGREPRVLWCGLGGRGLETLHALAGATEAAHIPLGFPAETRAFSPHITLGRAIQKRGRRPRKSPALRALEAALAELAPPPPCAFEVAALTLFESRLSPAGPSYQAVERLVLGE